METGTHTGPSCLISSFQHPKLSRGWTQGRPGVGASGLRPSDSCTSPLDPKHGPHWSAWKGRGPLVQKMLLRDENMKVV